MQVAATVNKKIARGTLGEVDPTASGQIPQDFLLILPAAERVAVLHPCYSDAQAFLPAVICDCLNG